MRSRPNRLGLYSDVKAVLDEAIASSGGTYTLPDHGKAVHWRQRAYKFRKLWAEVHGIKVASIYDQLTMPMIPDDSSDVIIRVVSQRGTFKPNAAPMTEEMIDAFDLPADDDPLLAEALELAKQIDGES